jgi:hypothetical protein
MRSVAQHIGYLETAPRLEFDRNAQSITDRHAKENRFYLFCCNFVHPTYSSFS